VALSFPLKYQAAGGQVQVSLPVQKGVSHGAHSTLNFSECPNVVKESSLSQVLVKGSIPQKYFLSVRACAGILARAQKRGKQLPPSLKAALERSAKQTIRPEPSRQAAEESGGGAETLIIDISHRSDVIRECGETSPTLTARMGTGGNNVPCIQEEAAVRRLTPVECERLQGFPDDWTKISYRGKSEDECPDSPRYKAIGNSWAVPVVRWLGERIQEELNNADTKEKA